MSQQQQQTPSLAEVAQGRKFYGTLTGQLVNVYPARTVNTKTGQMKQVIDAEISDGTASLKISFWDPTVPIMVGNSYTITNVYSKTYSGQNTLALSLKSEVLLNGGGFAPSPAPSQPAYSPTQHTVQTPQTPVNPLPVHPLSKKYLSEEEIVALIKEAKHIDSDEILDLLVEKNSAGGMLDRFDALVIIAKTAGLAEEITVKPVKPKPFLAMSGNELMRVYETTENGATRGLIEKVMMHKQWLAVKKTEIALKRLELKLVAKVNKITEDYEKITAQKAKEMMENTPSKAHAAEVGVEEEYPDIPDEFFDEEFFKE